MVSTRDSDGAAKPLTGSAGAVGQYRGREVDRGRRLACRGGVLPAPA